MDLRAARRRDYITRISGLGGAFYRSGGLVSIERAMQVYDACEEVFRTAEAAGKPLTRAMFRRQVNARLHTEPYNFSIGMLLLILKLVTLFIDLWFILNHQGEQDGPNTFHGAT